VSQRFAGPPPVVNHDWQYDEFCLVANYLLHPLKSVEMVRIDDGADLEEYLRKRRKV
jgi:hypothetical protein